MSSKRDPFDFLDAPHPEPAAPAPKKDEIELDWGKRENREPPAGRAPIARAILVRELAPNGDPLMEANGFAVRQLKEWTEILIDWETRNRYQVMDAAGRTVGYAGELGGGAWDALLRNFWAFRVIHLQFVGVDGRPLLTVRKPWTFFFAKAEVFDGDGRPLGVIQQRFKLFGRRLEILSPEGRSLAMICGPLLKPWTFNIMQGEREVATIVKKWDGIGRELFTDADTFGVRFRPSIELPFRKLVLAATLMIDFAYFEHRQRRGPRIRIGLFGD